MISALVGIEKPIEAIGNALNTLFTSDDERAQAAIVMEKLRQHPDELRLEFEKLSLQIETDDRKSARDMQVALSSSTVTVLTYLITAGFFGLLALIILDDDGIAHTYKDVLNILLGALSAAWLQVVSFFFGATSRHQ